MVYTVPHDMIGTIITINLVYIPPSVSAVCRLKAISLLYKKKEFELEIESTLL